MPYRLSFIYFFYGKRFEMGIVCVCVCVCVGVRALSQAVKFDQGHLSSLVLMLFQRAISSVTVAHRLYW